MKKKLTILSIALLVMIVILVIVILRCPCIQELSSIFGYQCSVGVTQ